MILVFLTTVIFGSLLISLTRKYELNFVEEKLDTLSEFFIPKLSEFTDFEHSKTSINELINGISPAGVKEQIFVVSKNKIIATTSHKKSIYAYDTLNTDLLISAESGKPKSGVYGQGIKSFDKAYPVYKNSFVACVLYIKRDISGVEAKTRASIIMILESLVASLSITFILAVIIASGIVNPIKNITRKATSFASGNFDERISVQSDDEIGELSQTFNYMADELSYSLEALFKEKNKLEVIVNNMADGLIAVNKSKEIIHINPMAKTILKKLNIANSDNYDDIAVNLPESLYFDNIVKNADLKVNIEDKDYHFIARYEVFYNEIKDFAGFILVIQDTTKEYKLEKMRKEFVANVSHELKTPITSIKSYSETLIDSDIDDQTTIKSFLEVINSEADRMGRLVYDLLELSNYDADIVNLNLNKYSLVELCKLVVKKLDIQLKNKKISLEIKYQEDIKAEFDYDRIEQVLVNIIVNAIKYTNEGGKIIVHVMQEDNNVLIVVEDTGIGIEEKYIKSLFTRFYRVDKARERSRGGSGLGLSIVKQIVELHNGIVYCESEVGVGTKMFVKFPMMQDKVKDE